MKHAIETFHVRRAVSLQDRRIHGHTRFRAFSASTGFDVCRPLLPIEMDELDAVDETCLLTTYHGAEAVGAARLIQPCEALARHHGLEIGLPLAQKYDLTPLIAQGTLAEPGRLCVVPELRGTMAVPVTIDAVLQESRRRGIDFLMAGANAETDDLEDARIQLGVLAARGLASDRHYVARKPTAEALGSAQRPFYSAVQRERAAQGVLARLPFARTLALYARIGARFVGEPALDPVFGLYAIPFVIAVAEAPQLVTPRPALPCAA
jgi:hypothetical protein